MIGVGEEVGFDLRADHEAIRDVIKRVALVAVLDDPSLSVSEENRRLLLGEVTGGLFSAQDGITLLRANLGQAEARIEQATTRIESELSGFELARNSLLSVDPFETATELESVQSQLETIYTVTARTSRLSLVNFLS